MCKEMFESGERALGNTIIFGFDSAWTDTNAGAICAMLFDNQGNVDFIPPELVGFKAALRFINNHKPPFARKVVAIDQPTIVPNASGMRPVERLAGSVLGYTGGGVQPANTGKANMFGPEAPIWEFKKSLGADDDPEIARDAGRGLFLIEVFPALALPGLHAPFAGRYCAPKYNPKNRKFRSTDWSAVVETAIKTAHDLKLKPCADWCNKNFLAVGNLGKSHQDQLDSVICALIGCVWLSRDCFRSMLLGGLDTGYMVTPVSCKAASRLHSASIRKGIPCKELLPVTICE